MHYVIHELLKLCTPKYSLESALTLTTRPPSHRHYCYDAQTLSVVTEEEKRQDLRHFGRVDVYLDDGRSGAEEERTRRWDVGAGTERRTASVERLQATCRTQQMKQLNTVIEKTEKSFIWLN